MSDAERLSGYVEVWGEATRDVLVLLRSLEPNDWEKPTDLPGWNVRYVAAHLAHLESELAGLPQQHVDVPEATHIKGLMGQFTEMGPLARATWTAEQVIDQLEEAVALRTKAMRAAPPTDGSAVGPSFAALIGWSWETLLSNRAFDVWMHEQDIRRAVGMPGGLLSKGAAHVADVFGRSLPYVVAKRVAAPAGSTFVLHVTGPQQRVLSAAVNDEGRGVPLPQAPDEPTARVTLDFSSWVVLAGGRRTPDQVVFAVDGDEELGRAVLDNLAVTP
jgi:uncharacterized protein (TIGR03083 family)